MRHCSGAGRTPKTDGLSFSQYSLVMPFNGPVTGTVPYIRTLYTTVPCSVLTIVLLALHMNQASLDFSFLSFKHKRSQFPAFQASCIYAFCELLNGQPPS